MEPYVAIILGSESDRKIFDASEMTEILSATGIQWEISYISAHRNPSDLEDYVKNHNVTVFIAAAGMSAALPGAIAAIMEGMVPVIGVPLPSTEYPSCEDALLSMVRMPPGMPVSVPGIGKSGLKNAAILAAQIHAVTDTVVREALVLYHHRNVKPAQIGVDNSWER